MKTVFALLLVCCFGLVPVVSQAQAGREEQNIKEIRGFLGRKEFAKAQVLIDAELERTVGVKPAPYIENGKLYLYGETSAESLMLLLMVSARKINKDGAPEKIDWLPELDGGADWKEAVVIAPYRPFLFFARAYIAVENGDADGASAALEEALRLHPHYLAALAEKNHLLMSAGRFEEAKALARAAIDDTYPQDEKGKAVFWRNLGYMAIEEDDLVAAEEDYRQSLKLEPGNKIALDELRYIDSLKKKVQ
jgi:tetratricopeptide (TPR) repeat protein